MSEEQTTDPIEETLAADETTVASEAKTDAELAAEYLDGWKRSQAEF